MLVQYLNVTDVNELAAKQFRAKSHSLSLMTPYALVNGDVKQFKARPITLAPIRPRSRGERRSLRTFARRISPLIPRFQSRHTTTPFNSC